MMSALIRAKRHWNKAQLGLEALADTHSMTEIGDDLKGISRAMKRVGFGDLPAERELIFEKIEEVTDINEKVRKTFQMIENDLTDEDFQTLSKGAFATNMLDTIRELNRVMDMLRRERN